MSSQVDTASEPCSCADTGATENPSGMVFNIQRFSVHDGPGIRTTVFLKGCNLRCFWCHNPEGISRRRELQFYEDKCVACGNCVRICPNGAHSFDADGRHRFHRELCEQCGKCVQECYVGALELPGEVRTVSEVFEIVDQDSVYYEQSGGGVTFSGGEPVMSMTFLTGLLEAAKARSLHTAVETAANVAWPRFERILPLVDLFMVDLKHIDSAVHRQAVGVHNHLILDNLEKMTSRCPHVWVRVPVIPGVNADSETLARMAEFLARLGRPPERVDLLPFHRLGGAKYKSLGREYQAADLVPPSKDEMTRYREIFKESGLAVSQ